MSVIQERNKLTGIRDLDYMILNQLSDKDLYAVCQVNKEVNKLCNDDRYWQQRVKHVFELSNEDMNKYKNMMEIDTWKEFYQWLRDTITPPIKNLDSYKDDPIKIAYDEFIILKIYITDYIPNAYQILQLPEVIEEINHIKSHKYLPKWINKKELLKEWKTLWISEPIPSNEISKRNIEIVNALLADYIKELFKNNERITINYF